MEMSLEATSWSPQFETVLRARLPLLSPDEPLPPDVNLQNLGLDSLDTVQLMGDLESEFSIVFTDDLLTAATFSSAGKLWAAVAQLSADTPPGT